MIALLTGLSYAHLGLAFRGDGAARLVLVMAQEHAIPAIFSMRERYRQIPYVSLLVLTAASLALTLAGNLAVTSTLASATFLLIFAAVNLSAWRLCGRIGLHPLPPLAGALLAGGSCAVLLWHSWHTDRGSLLWIAAIYGIAAVTEAALVWRRGVRRINTEPGSRADVARPPPHAR